MNICVFNILLNVIYIIIVLIQDLYLINKSWAVGYVKIRSVGFADASVKNINHFYGSL